MCTLAMFAFRLRLLLAALIVASELRGLGSALVCYNNDDGEMKPVDSPTYKYCVMTPGIKEVNGKTLHSSQYGLTDVEDDTDAYDKIFEGVTMLSMCIQEKYDFAALARSSTNPKFFNSKKLLNQEPEFLIRCICRENYCNFGSTVQEFYSNQENLDEHYEVLKNKV